MTLASPARCWARPASMPIDQHQADAGWAILEPLLPMANRRGRPRADLRQIFSAIHYVPRSGAQRRMVARDLGPWVIHGDIDWHHRLCQTSVPELPGPARGHFSCVPSLLAKKERRPTYRTPGARGSSIHSSPFSFFAPCQRCGRQETSAIIWTWRTPKLLRNLVPFALSSSCARVSISPPVHSSCSTRELRNPSKVSLR